MTSLIKNIQQTRQVFTELVKQQDLTALNIIPPGFNNNIAWNYGHIMVTTLALCYHRSGVHPDLVIPFQDIYGKGSRPTFLISQEEIDMISEALTHSMQQILTHYEEGRFDSVTPFSTSTYGLELQNIEEILQTCLMHDNLHLGYAMALKRTINL